MDSVDSFCLKKEPDAYSSPPTPSQSYFPAHHSGHASLSSFGQFAEFPPEGHAHLPCQGYDLETEMRHKRGGAAGSM